MTCSDAGRLGAERRKEIERESIRRKALQMLAEMGKGPDPRLFPPLILTPGDRL
jgi:hypothetical protein